MLYPGISLNWEKRLQKLQSTSHIIYHFNRSCAKWSVDICQQNRKKYWENINFIHIFIHFSQSLKWLYQRYYSVFYQPGRNCQFKVMFCWTSWIGHKISTYAQIIENNKHNEIMGFPETKLDAHRTDRKVWTYQE